MLTNECHECENFIEFPDYGVGEKIQCPHCGLQVVLTAESKTASPEANEQSDPPEVEAEKSAKTAELAAVIELLKSGRSQGRRPRRSRRARRKRLLKLWAMIGGVAILLVLAIVLITAVQRHRRFASFQAGRQLAVGKMAQDAAAARAPTGLFGTKWLMSAADVMKAEPGVKRLSQGVLGETRTFYDRQAMISYHFTNDLLLMTQVSFVGTSTLDDFDRTQARLSTEYGRMPRAAQSLEYTLSSTKKINHFVIQHCLSESSGLSVEQVFFYVSGGGNPKSMPKFSPPTPKG
jgi:uncharacterized Zn finger protein (UPF0148 family)